MSSSFFVTGILVETGCGRRQQDNISLLSIFSCFIDRLNEIVDDDRIRIEIFGDPFAGDAEADDLLDAGKMFPGIGHIQAFFIAADQEDDAFFKSIEGRVSGIGIGRFGIIVIGDAVESPDVFDSILYCAFSWH